jgi:hypothetical protein
LAHRCLLDRSADGLPAYDTCNYLNNDRKKCFHIVSPSIASLKADTIIRREIGESQMRKCGNKKGRLENRPCCTEIWRFSYSAAIACLGCTAAE